MADYLPKFGGDLVATLTTSADVTGGRVLIASGANTVAHSGADAANVIGVAAKDATSGDPVGVFLRPGGIHKLTASGGIAAGAKVVSDTAGKVKTIGAGSNPIGIALNASTNDGDIILVLFL